MGARRRHALAPDRRRSVQPPSGNHDLSPTGEATAFNRHFGPERFEAFDWYGEGNPAGTNNNNYQLFSAGGYRLGPLSLGADDFLVLAP